MSETDNTNTPTVEVAGGAFVQSLKRSNRDIKHDRATAIAEDAQLVFKREIEDLGMKLKRLQRKRENMLDLSPSNTHSLMLAEEFDAKGFVEEDLKIAVEVRNLEIKIELGQKRYEFLFGETVEV